MISVWLNLTLFCAFLSWFTSFHSFIFTSIFCIAVVMIYLYIWLVITSTITKSHFWNLKIAEDVFNLKINPHQYYFSDCIPKTVLVFSHSKLLLVVSLSPLTENKQLTNAHILVKFSPFSLVVYFGCRSWIENSQRRWGKVCRHGDAIDTSLWTI